MNRNRVVRAFLLLGELMENFGSSGEWPGYSCGLTLDEFQSFNALVEKQIHSNGWFTAENTRKSLLALSKQLKEEDLLEWISTYEKPQNSKRAALIMAGNIPLVGFHDFLCVLISGHSVVVKLSSDDRFLLPALSDFLVKIEPSLKDRITFTQGRIGEVDAVIATGSDNSSIYFDQYFGKYPHVFRKNRTSVAILDGSESEEELTLLGKDIFEYFGLGCRNVSHLLIPVDFNLDAFFAAIFPYSEIIQHHKYANNYDYQKAVHLLNNIPLLDNNFVLLRETPELFSPLGMVHYHYFKDQNDIEDYLEMNADKIQAIVGHAHIPFGQAQCPSLTDYADGVDTMDFLQKL
ncbi:MAG: hypothetical protein RIT43_710 [Bacteroidota bacterium]